MFWPCIPSLTLVLVVFATVLNPASAVKTCNVQDFGAVPDNQTDIGPALMKAFECAKASVTARSSDTVILVPAGNYKLASKVVFDKSKFLTVTVHGHLYMPYDPKLQDNMILFSHCQNIVFNGGGRVYGNGDRYRPGGNLHLNPRRPRLVRFDKCDTVDYSGVNLYDAPLYHLVIWQGTNVHIHNFEIHSANIGSTDGINVAGSNIYVHDVVVENGDECVTAKSPMVGLQVENIQCINGCGCGVGSMGSNQQNYNVQNINYRNVTVTNGANGMIIKSYPGASGVIKNLTYSNFELINVAYPIKLDYTWGATLKPQWTKRHKRAEAIQTWSDITFNNFHGTGTKYRSTVTLNCPSHSPCNDLKFNNVQLSGSTKSATMINACGTVDAISRQTIPNLPPC